METNDSLWQVVETQFDPQRMAHSETIFTIGNGLFCTRGAFEEYFPNEERTTFMHGIFDDVPVVFTEIVNLPDWLELEIFLEGERFSLYSGQVLSYNRRLDLRTATLTRSIRWQSPAGKITDLIFERFASLAEPHLALVRVQAQPVNYDGRIELRAGLCGESDNNGLKHWMWLNQASGAQFSWLHLQTRKTGMELGIGMRLHVDMDNAALPVEGCDVRNHPAAEASAFVKRNHSITAEKAVYIYSSRQASHPEQVVMEQLRQRVGAGALYAAALKAHVAAWQTEWEQNDILIEGDDEAQLAIRFSIYHLLIAAPRSDDNVSIGAKTLSGLGYRGHVFWDTETFMLPMFIYTRPEIAANLLGYRFHRLEGARKKARSNACLGAQYPWESAYTGEEVTPAWVPHYADRNRMVRIWTGDIEIHIGADITQAILKYWHTTGDDHFMQARGAEMVLDIARFWASRAEWHADKARYEYRDVIGPDEYHEHVDNNAYTNYLARYALQTAQQVLDWLRVHDPHKAAELTERLELTPTELTKWQHVIDYLYLPFNPATQLIEQFTGYFQREDVDLAAMEPRTKSVQEILGIEGANQTQVLKQPDVLMMLYLLGDSFNGNVLATNYAYYAPRTDHTYGSSLGPSMMAIVAAQLNDLEAAYEHFMRAARADLRDVRGNAGDGIHGASAGGLWQAVVFGFGGVKVTPQGYQVKPRLPAHWKRLAFKLKWLGETIGFDIHQEQA